jgi:hypothetical protein
MVVDSGGGVENESGSRTVRSKSLKITFLPQLCSRVNECPPTAMVWRFPIVFALILTPGEQGN